MGEIQKKRLWEIDNLPDFIKATGYMVDIEALAEAKKKMQKQTIYGNVDLNTYDGLIMQKIFEYYKFGVFENITKMMLSQDTKTSQNEIKNILLDMARYEIEYGLKPLIHTIPIAKKVYITAEGFLFYAENSGKIKSMEFETKEEKGLYTTVCTIETTDGRKQQGFATVKPTSNRMDDPAERSRTKAMRRALRRLFPIGALAEEAFIEKVENQGVIPKMPEIAEISEEDAKIIDETYPDFQEKKENVEKQIIEKAKPVEEPEADEKIFPDKKEEKPKKKRKSKKKVANPYNDIEQLKAEPEEELPKEPDEYGTPDILPEDEEKKKKIASSLFDL